MTTATWLVMFAKERVPDRQAVLDAVARVRDCRVRSVVPDDYEVRYHRLVFNFALNVEPYVLQETREFVELAGGELKNREEVATFDARFEILFDGRKIGDLFNPLLAVADELAALTGGITYEVDNRAFQ